MKCILCHEEGDMYHQWTVIVLGLTLIVAGVLELIAVYSCDLGVRGSCSYATISYLIFTYVPRGVRAMLLCWLVYHFIIKYSY
jgi:hypothetical protein